MNASPITYSGKEPEYYEKLVNGIRDFLHTRGFQKAIIGLSGGIDSALVATLASAALGNENVRGFSMPSPYSSQHSKDDAKELADTLHIAYQTISIAPCFEKLKETLRPVFQNAPEDLAEENMQARLRGIILMSISNKQGGMVLTTGNKSEISVGYCTLYGDTCGGLAPISSLYKTEVYQLSYWINEQAGHPIIPLSTLTKAPSAELRPNQTDQDSLPPYDILDAILRLYVDQKMDKQAILTQGFDEKTVDRIVGLVERSAYKRSQLAPTILL